MYKTINCCCTTYCTRTGTERYVLLLLYYFCMRADSDRHGSLTQWSKGAPEPKITRFILGQARAHKSISAVPERLQYGMKEAHARTLTISYVPHDLQYCCICTLGSTACKVLVNITQNIIVIRHCSTNQEHSVSIIIIYKSSPVRQKYPVTDTYFQTKQKRNRTGSKNIKKNPGRADADASLGVCL